MSEAAASRSEIWRRRLRRVRAGLRRGLPFASGAAAMLVVLAIYNALTPAPPPITLRDVNDAISQALASATPPPAFSSLVYPVIQPSLVIIKTSLSNENSQRARFSGTDVLVDQRFRLLADEGLGSGVIIDDSGSILTSLHVVAGAPNIELTFADGTQASGEVVGAQPENDIAVLSASDLPEEFVPATLGNPNSMRVGDEAYVVGNPLDLYGSMSAGVISGFGRTYEVPDSDVVFQDLIQFDAAINPGSSGGPLLNRDGFVVGIVTVLLNPTGQAVFAGIGFAVPITTAGGAAGAPPV